MDKNRVIYTNLEDRFTKKNYRDIVDKALAQAKKEYEQCPDSPMNISFYNQLKDIKKTVIEDYAVYTENEAYKKYPMALMVVRNFLGEESDTDYAHWLTTVVWGISFYPDMMEDIEIINQKLFDGDEAAGRKEVFRIGNHKFKFSDFYDNPLRELKKEIGDMSFGTVITEGRFNLSNTWIEKYSSEKGLEIYYLKKNEVVYLFSCGEYQPGRYMLFLEGICHYRA